MVSNRSRAANWMAVDYCEEKCQIDGQLIIMRFVLYIAYTRLSWICNNNSKRNNWKYQEKNSDFFFTFLRYKTIRVEQLKTNDKCSEIEE